MADLEDPVQSGLEIQILDTHGKEPTTNHDCGALYDALGPTRNTCKPAGEWNQMTITCDGSIVVVALNDEEIVRADLDDWDTPHRNRMAVGINSASRSRIFHEVATSASKTTAEKSGAEILRSSHYRDVYNYCVHAWIPGSAIGRTKKKGIHDTA